MTSGKLTRDEVYPWDFFFSGPMFAPQTFPVDRQADSSVRRMLPAWLTSMVFHCLLLIVLVLSMRSIPRGVVAEPDRTTGIVLKHMTQTGEYYEGEDLDREVAADSAAATETALSAGVLPGEGEAPLEASAFLPDPASGAGPEAAAKPGGGRLSLAGNGEGEKNVDGGKVRTGIFGVTGVGNKFVYVFDRSSSMEGRPLAAAKQELTNSLERLGKLNQFEIIFYNEFLDIFHPTENQKLSGRLFFATAPNKAAADNFIRRVTASGATRHLEPLLKAVAMNPDNIFFLTDGTEPRLNDEELFRIRRRNGGRASIHVIQFGSEVDVGDNWIKKLARQNRGDYLFFNTDRLSPINVEN